MFIKASNANWTVANYGNPVWIMIENIFCQHVCFFCGNHFFAHIYYECTKYVDIKKLAESYSKFTVGGCKLQPFGDTYPRCLVSWKDFHYFEYIHLLWTFDSCTALCCLWPYPNCEKWGNRVFAWIINNIVVSRSTLWFFYCGFPNRKPATIWSRLQNPPVPTTGSCW